MPKKNKQFSFGLTLSLGKHFTEYTTKKKRLTKNRRKTVRKKNTDENDIFLCEHFRVSWHFFSCRSNIRHKSMAFQPIEINSTSNKNTIYLLFIIKVLFSSSQCCYSFELKKKKKIEEKWQKPNINNHLPIISWRSTASAWEKLR